MISTFPDGTLMVGPLREEVQIVEDALLSAGASRSLVWIERNSHRADQLREFRHINGSLQVLVSGMWRPDDDRFWLHVSVCGRARLPTWEELKDVKDVFVGIDRRAMQLLPRADEFININPFVLHLWCCLTEDIIPNFGKQGSI